MVLPSGTTAQRPTTPAIGSMRLNTDTNDTEFWDGTVWTASGATGSGSTTGSVIAFYTGETSGMSGTGTIPYDNTTPQSTEGTQIWTKTVTPASANSKFVITQSFMVDSATSSKNITFALFRGTTCIYATSTYIATSGKLLNAAIHCVDKPNTTANTTYSLRVGINSSTTWYINQSVSVPVTYGGTVNKSDWTITEIN
jgi:hypothetical protein